ncbi:MAG: hypothetical protein KUG81_05175, partial [Gammaproteobacteria bacterium]|nr:hypothetical protein [Gammaproteobacteria bacterium]
MAIKKVIEIDVNTGDASAELEKLEGSFKEVDKAAEKTNKSVDDVAGNGGAIAILDQLTGGLATRFRDAFEASKLFNLSLKGTRAALIATGVGAFVVALGLIVTYWDDIVDFITQANAKLENQLTLVQSIQTVLDGELATITKQIELNKLQGKANEELEKQRVAILKRLQEQNEAEIKLLENQLDRLKATSTEVGFWETIKNNVAFTLFGTQALASESANLAAQRLKEINDLSAAIEGAKLKEIDLEIQLFNAANGGGGEGNEKRTATGVGFNATKLNKEAEENAIARQEELDAALAQAVSLEEITETSARIQSETELKWADLTAQAKLGIAGAV